MKQLLLFILVFFLMSCDSDSTRTTEPIDVPIEEEKEEEVPLEAGALLDAVLSKKFNDIISVEKDSRTYRHLLALAEEAVSQAMGKSKNGLPLLYQENNFPTVYNYYTNDTTAVSAAYKTMIGWLTAMQLSELCPAKRNQLYKAGYEAGGYSMKSKLYGYSFMTDPNVARLVASAVYAALHPSAWDVSAMQMEVGGSKYYYSLEVLYDEESRAHVTDDAFYVDLRQFMASAPGPYAPGYGDRSTINPTFPDDKASNGCLKVDMDVYNYVIENLNLPEDRAVQAIADQDADMHHLFGTDKRDVGGQYDFNAVFGPKTIGETIDPEGGIASLIELFFKTGSSGRGILQHANASLGGIEYGRLRPGCSENEELVRKSYTDDRLNVLSCFAIEDNDGHKVTYDDNGVEVYYYDEEGNWTHYLVQSEDEYEDYVKDMLYANSYPSGHAAGIWSAALTLIELYPQKADLIMRAANDFAVSRVICRYHWNSDIIQGRIIGSIMNPICHATTDYNRLLNAAINER